MSEIVVKIGNIVSKIETDRDTLRRMDREIRFEIPSAKFIPGFRGDGYWHPISPIRSTIPTGLLSKLRRLFPLAKFVDERKRPEPHKFRADIISGITPSGFQIRCVEKFLAGWGRGIFALATGAGKTECGIMVAEHIPGLCVWLCHRKSLLHQTAERILARTGQTAAKIGDGLFDELTPGHKYLIAMPQTIVNERDAFRGMVQKASILICDESHIVASASSFYRVAQMVPAYWRLGLTATPETGNPDKDARMMATTGPVVARARAGKMADVGRVVPCLVKYHQVGPPTSDQIAECAGEVLWAILRKTFIENHDARNRKIIALAVEEARNGRKILIICDTVRHLKILSELMNCEDDVRFAALTGKNSTAQRIRATKDIRAGVIDIIFATPIFDEGVDIPELDVMILAAGGKSVVKVIQRIGRALRTSKGKTEAIVHDFMDTGSRVVRRHFLSRVKACRAEGFKISGCSLSNDSKAR